MTARCWDRTRWDGLQATALVLLIAVIGSALCAAPYVIAHGLITGWLR